MQWKSSPVAYGAVAIALHWASAALFVMLLVSGFRAAGTIDPQAKLMLLRVHAAAGSTALALTLARLAWWRFADRPPAAPQGQAAAQARAARLVHRLFYVVILVLAGTGIGMVVLSGAAPILLGQVLAPLPAFDALPPRALHGVAVWALLGLIAAHVGAAFYHQFVLGDRLLARIGIGRAAA